MTESGADLKRRLLDRVTRRVERLRDCEGESLRTEAYSVRDEMQFLIGLSHTERPGDPE